MLLVLQNKEANAKCIWLLFWLKIVISQVLATHKVTELGRLLLFLSPRWELRSKHCKERALHHFQTGFGLGKGRDGWEEGSSKVFLILISSELAVLRKHHGSKDIYFSQNQCPNCTSRTGVPKKLQGLNSTRAVPNQSTPPHCHQNPGTASSPAMPPASEPCSANSTSSGHGDPQHTSSQQNCIGFPSQALPSCTSLPRWVYLARPGFCCYSFWLTKLKLVGASLPTQTSHLCSSKRVFSSTIPTIILQYPCNVLSTEAPRGLAINVCYTTASSAGRLKEMYQSRLQSN